MPQRPRSFFPSWVANTQRNHWTKWVASTQEIAQDPRKCPSTLAIACSHIPALPKLTLHGCTYISETRLHLDILCTCSPDAVPELSAHLLQCSLLAPVFFSVWFNMCVDHLGLCPIRGMVCDCSAAAKVGFLGVFTQERNDRRASRFRIWMCCAWRTPWASVALPTLEGGRHYDWAIRSLVTRETWLIDLLVARGCESRKYTHPSHISRLIIQSAK